MLFTGVIRSFVACEAEFRPSTLYYFQEDVQTCLLNNFVWTRPVRPAAVVAFDLVCPSSTFFFFFFSSRSLISLC